MLEAINLSDQRMTFRSEKPEKVQAVDETRILPNTLNTRLKQDFQKTSSAFIDYPAKGLTGDINSNFYEFLTMGIVPYLAGSAMFMVAFNCVNKILEKKGRKIASDSGYKMALGVVLYGVLKTLSKSLVTKPVKMATGVDTEMPYENIVYPLPKEAGEAANIEVQHQQRKVYDSKEFFRKDLLDRAYFDKVAKKLCMGSNLNDSVSEATPIIQNIVATTNTAKSLSSYCWGALGVMLAVQPAWTEFFNSFKDKKLHAASKEKGFIKNFGSKMLTIGENTWNITKAFFKSLGKSIGQLWTGRAAKSGFMKHGGKVFMLLTAAVTALLTGNAITRAKNLAKNNNENRINNTKESKVI